MLGDRMDGRLENRSCHPRDRDRLTVRQHPRDDNEANRIYPCHDAPTSGRGAHSVLPFLIIEVSGFSTLPFEPPRVSINSANRWYRSWCYPLRWRDGSARPLINLSCADPCILLSLRAPNSSNLATFRHRRTRIIPFCIRTPVSFVYDWR